MSGIEWRSGQTGAEDFIIPAEGGRRAVTGALWLPGTHDERTPLILCGHGASGDRYQAPIPHLAERFLKERGFATLAIDGPVHGLRQVGPGGREALAEEMQRTGFIEDMVDDWLLAFDTVASEKAIGNGALGYFGLSMGTIFGLPLLAEAKNRGLTFNASTLGLAGTIGVGDYVGERLEQAARQVDHPVLFLMQLEDEIFPRDGYLTLFDSLASDDKRLHANPGLHPEIPSEEIDCTFQFLAIRMEQTVTREITNPIAD